MELKKYGASADRSINRSRHVGYSTFRPRKTPKVHIGWMQYVGRMKVHLFVFIDTKVTRLAIYSTWLDCRHR